MGGAKWQYIKEDGKRRDRKNVGPWKGKKGEDG
jgi:hypothetical protein